MLISISHKFIFIANLKTASSAIEHALKPYSEICIDRTEYGKHDGFEEIISKYSSVFDIHPLSEFLIFSCLRSPVSWLSSLYRSLKKTDFSSSNLSTSNIDFDKFIELWKDISFNQMAPQFERISDSDGNLNIDYLIDYHRLQEQFDVVCDLVRIPRTQLDFRNSSVDIDIDYQISQTSRDLIQLRYASDFMIADKTGRLLRGVKPVWSHDLPMPTSAEAWSPASKQPVHRDDIIWAHRMILGRDPIDNEIDFCRDLSMNELRSKLLNSDEFGIFSFHSGEKAIDDNTVSRSIMERIGYRGDYANGVYRALFGGTNSLCRIPHPIPFSSTLCQQSHFGFDQYKFWVKELKDIPRLLRKQWEFFYICQVLHERGMLVKERKGLGFGVGMEPLPALFASYGCAILATDQGLEGAMASGWVKSSEHSKDLSSLNGRGICIDAMFNALVSFQELDMNEINSDLYDKFDFCWSSCCLEHLGSLRHGMEFVKNSIKTLKQGGIAVHTTEFNLNSNSDTIEAKDLSIYRRRDIEILIAELQASGYIVSPVDWTVGEGMAESVVDLPPYGRGEPHVRLDLHSYACTSIGIIVQKPM